MCIFDSLTHFCYLPKSFRHFLCKVKDIPPPMQAYFVNASIHFAVCQSVHLQHKVTINHPNIPIWFVVYGIWFVVAHFDRPNTQQLLRITSISSLLSPNTCTTQIIVVYLHRQIPPRLFNNAYQGGTFAFYTLCIIRNNRWIIPRFYKC